MRKQTPQPRKNMNISKIAMYQANKKEMPERIKAPQINDGVVTEGETAAIAADAAVSVYDYAAGSMFVGDFTPFPGYPYLSQLVSRAEFRQVSSTIANEMTREWITLISKSDEETQNEKISLIQDKLTELDARGVCTGCIALLHLGPACEARTHEVAVGVAGDGGGKVAHKRGLLGARANQAHVAHEHVEELWQFV